MTLKTNGIRSGARSVVAAWAALGAVLLGGTAILAVASPLFGYTYQVIDMPVFWLAGGLCAAGALVLSLLLLVPVSATLRRGTARVLLWAILAAGLVMRLVLFASEPALEDDYQRYLWDGAVTAHGQNPYAVAPVDAATKPDWTAPGTLARDSGLVLERVNHPDLRTLYPPVVQGAFALSHLIAPWSLTGWRAVILLLDIASVALLILLLRDLGRSPLWVALYWWNPIVLKELFNSAHMEAVVTPLVLGALLLAIRKRPLAASSVLTIAAGAKIWPALLLPLVWRNMLERPRKLALAIALALAAGALFAWPMLAAGLDQTSGLVAYASRWKTNSALFPLIEGVGGGLLARASVVASLFAVVIWQCRTAAQDTQELINKALVITTAAFLLSPAQFPWYFLWVLPLLPLRPVPGLLVLTATLPLYYTTFHFLPRGTYETFSGTIVWLIWLPAWALLLWHARGFIAPIVPARTRRTA
jgi:alpha-1,6-mannosyltransferase